MERRDARVRDALDACTEPALALDARGKVLAANAALFDRLGLSTTSVARQVAGWHTDGVGTTHRRSHAPELSLQIGTGAARRFCVTAHRALGRGQTLALLRTADEPAPAAVLLERQLDLREHTGEAPHDFFREATETLAEALAVEQTAIWLFDERRQELVCADRFTRRSRVHHQGDRFLAADHPEYFQAVTDRRAIVADDVLADPTTRHFAERRLAPCGVRALLDVAIRSGPQLRGMLCLGHVGGVRSWRPEDVKFALGVANQAMIAIAERERRDAERALRELAASLEHRVAERTAALAAAERRSRELLATLDATVDAAFVFDPKTLRFTYVNAGAVRQSGFAREELLAMTPLELAQDVDEGSFRRLLDSLRHGERQTTTLPAAHRRRDGGSLPVEVNLQLVEPADGEPRFLAIARDLTERLRTERIARRTERLQSLGTLAGGIAHDLNNALTPAMVAAEELRAGEPASPSTLALLEQSFRRAIEMVRALLAFAKGQEGRSESLSPRKLVEEVLRIAQATFPRRIVASAEFADDLPPVLGDGTQLHQVLLNLAVNARDAMPEGGRLRFAATRTRLDAAAGAHNSGDFTPPMVEARPGDYVVLRVQDDGVGIPADVLDRIFEPFFTTKGPEKGTGLGLSTTLGIVRSHGGFVQVRSEPGAGTTFAVHLPIAPARPAPTMSPSVACDRDGAVLFVDDDDIVRRAAERIFRRLGIGFEACADANAAIAQLRAAPGRFRGLVTDLHMPQQDGCRLIAMARELAPGLPVAVASGFVDDEARQQLHELGVRHVLHKPFDQAAVARFLAGFGR